MFNVIWTRLVSWLLPIFLNKVRQNDWLNACLKPLSELYQTFLSYKDETLYDLYITGQVISLELMLNDRLNGGIAAWTFNTSDYTYTSNTTNGIYIVDFENALPHTYLWTRAEARPPVRLYTRGETYTPHWFLYTRAEYANQPDFIIMVPTALADITTDTLFVNKMKALVNANKQAGARYTIANY